MKIVQYDPKEITNTAEFLNKYLEEFKDEKFVMFIFKDIIEAVKDKEILAKKYEALLTTLNIPYAFFPYYVHFNKILPGLSGLPSPRLRTKRSSDSFEFDIVQEPTYGLLVLDIQKLNEIGFKFNPVYKHAFYLQNLIKTCFDKKIYPTKSFFFDVHNSYELFNSDFTQPFMFAVKDFAEEKKLFFENEMKNDNTQETINDFVKYLKDTYGTKEPQEPQKSQENKAK